MNYRPLGATGLSLSEIGFGTGDNAGLFISGTLAEAARIMGRAFELGINYVDTAAGYGATKSETTLGQVLRELRVRPIITSKFEITTDQVGDVAGAVVASVEGSLKRLGVDYLDIVQVHNSPAYKRPEGWTGGPTGPWMPMLVEEYLGPNGALEGLRRLRESGKARFTGIAGVGADGPLSKIAFGAGNITLLNVHYNLLNPTAGMPKPLGLQVDQDLSQIMNYAMLHNCGCAIINPLASGVLTDHSVAGGERHPLAGNAVMRNPAAYQRRIERARAFSFLARDGRTLAQAAIQFILAHPAVTTVLGGYTAVEHVEEAVGALTATPLNDEDMARIQLAWKSNLGELRGE